MWNRGQRIHSSKLPIHQVRSVLQTEPYFQRRRPLPTDQVANLYSKMCDERSWTVLYSGLEYFVMDMFKFLGEIMLPDAPARTNRAYRVVGKHLLVNDAVDDSVSRDQEPVLLVETCGLDIEQTLAKMLIALEVVCETRPQAVCGGAVVNKDEWIFLKSDVGQIFEERLPVVMETRRKTRRSVRVPTLGSFQGAVEAIAGYGRMSIKPITLRSLL